MATVSTPPLTTERLIDSLCYLFSGVTVLFIAVTATDYYSLGDAMVPILGLGFIGYGLYILRTRGSYWVTNYTYLIPIAVVIGAFFMIS